MNPIKLSEKERALLLARQAALNTAAQLIAELHDATAPGWTISPDFSELIPPPQGPGAQTPVQE